MSKTHWCGGFRMPSVGIGTWEANDPTELETALNAALEIGYRHIDTAYFYENEHVIGKVLTKWISSGKLKRQDLFIVTKLPVQGIHRDRVETFINKSLESLGLDYVDLYLIHFPVGVANADPTNFKLEEPGHKGVWQGMEEQVYSGKARTIGVSNFTSNQIEKILEYARIKPACNQVELHVFLQQPDLVKYCQTQNIEVVAYSPLASPGINKFCQRLGAPDMDIEFLNVFKNSIITEIAKKHKRSNGQVVMRYLLEQGIAVIPKSVNPKRLKENFDLYSFHLDKSDTEKLKKLDRGEEGRVVNWGIVMPYFKDHPDYPFPKK